MEKSVRRWVGGGGRSLVFLPCCEGGGIQRRMGRVWNQAMPGESCVSKGRRMHSGGVPSLRPENKPALPSWVSSCTLSGSSLCLSLWAAQERTGKVLLDSPHEQ